MSLKNVKNMREYLDLLEKEGELLRIKGEVDPIVQMPAIGKKLDGGPALLFENIKGYPHARTHYGTIEDRKLAKAMKIDFKQIKFKCIDAIILFPSDSSPTILSRKYPILLVHFPKCCSQKN